MSLKVMTRVWDQSKEAASDLLLLLALADWANDDGICWPREERLARKVRLSERQIQRMVSYLEGKRELFVLRGRGRGQRNNFIVMVGVGIETLKMILQVHFGMGPLEADALVAGWWKKGDMMSPFRDEKGDIQGPERVTSGVGKGDTCVQRPHELLVNRQESHTHTMRPEARVCVSRFSLGECLAYVDHLRADLGQRIRNQTGLAITLRRSGEADELIAAWLSMPPSASLVDPPGKVDGAALELFLETIRVKLNVKSFNEWFGYVRRLTRCVDPGREGIYLQVSTELARQWIQSSYLEVIEETLGEIGFGGMKFYLVGPEGK